MSTYISQGPGTGEKIMFVILGIVFIAFLAYIPFMIANKQERLERAWQEQGCQMYDTEVINNIPAKCHNDFTDHYKAQELRKQP